MTHPTPYIRAAIVVTLARKKAGLSLRKLADATQISPTMMSLIESGRSRPGVVTAQRLVHELLEVLEDTDLMLLGRVWGADEHVASIAWHRLGDPTFPVRREEFLSAKEEETT